MNAKNHPIEWADDADLFGHPTLRPQTPIRGRKAWLALLDLVREGQLTHPRWIEMRRGWRLAAAIKELRYMGWEIDAWWIHPEGSAHRIKCYSLHNSIRAHAQTIMKEIFQ